MTLIADLEDRVRRAALARYLEGDEEQALDLLVAAPAIAEPSARSFFARRTNGRHTSLQHQPIRQAVGAETRLSPHSRVGEI